MTLVDKLSQVVQAARTSGYAGIMDIVGRKLNPNLLNEQMARINHHGRGIVNFIDVGSKGGLPLEWRRRASRIRFLLNFEPRDKAFRSPNVVTMNVALWSESCTKEFFICKQGDGSSLFRQNYEYVRANFSQLERRGPRGLASTWFERSEMVSTEEIQCRTLDQVVNEISPPVQFHFVKLDAQGAEYEILRGAGSVLAAACVGLKVELFTLPMYERIHLQAEVEEYLRTKGFRLVKKFRPHGTFDAASDYLFMRDDADGEIAALIRDVYSVGPA